MRYMQQLAVAGEIGVDAGRRCFVQYFPFSL